MFTEWRPCTGKPVVWWVIFLRCTRCGFITWSGITYATHEHLVTVLPDPEDIR